MQNQTYYLNKDHTFSIESKEELTSSFRLRDQKKLILPEGLRFPFTAQSYLSWKEPSGVYTYLVFRSPTWDLCRGVAFKRTPATGEPVGGLCNWCHAYGSSEEIGMLSVAMNANVSKSYYLCQDLRCIEKIEDAAAMAGKNPEKNIAELFYRMEKLFESISGFTPD